MAEQLNEISTGSGDERMGTADDVIYLASCAVNRKVPENERISAMDLYEVYSLASRHMITAIIAFALESAGYKDKRSTNCIASAMRRTAIFEKEWGGIKQDLEDAHIWYMPLKGVILKEIYPKYGMREFSDYDILFDESRAGDVKTIMEKLGFSIKRFGYGNNDAYHKAPCLNFEMHRTLFGPRHDEKLYEYYKNVGERLLYGTGFERSFTSEDFYIYFLAHEYKHYAEGGTGLRSLLDTWVYLNHVTLDEEYVAMEVGKLGIADFEKQNRSLSLHLFGGKELTEPDKKMLDYILSSGTFGTIQHKVENKMREKGWNKLQYALSRFFVPVSKKNRYYTIYAGLYPFFYKHKIFFPFLPIYRTFRAMINGKFQAEVNALKDVDKVKSCKKSTK